jgi:hypothetical protein
MQHLGLKLILNFVDYNGGLTLVPVAFFLVPNLVTKIIAGNNLLAPMGAVIDRHDNTLSFKHLGGSIPITSRIPPKANICPIMPTPSAYLADDYTFLPGHQHRVNVSIPVIPGQTNYVLTGKSLGKHLFVSRSVGTSTSNRHFAHIVHLGERPMKLPKGTKIGTLLGTKDPQPISLSVQQETSVNLADSSQFPMTSIDINTDLSQSERQQIEQMLRRNSQAFGYGSRQLGTTTLAEMTIDTGNVRTGFGLE